MADRESAAPVARPVPRMEDYAKGLIPMVRKYDDESLERSYSLAVERRDQAQLSLDYAQTLLNVLALERLDRERQAAHALIHLDTSIRSGCNCACGGPCCFDGKSTCICPDCGHHGAHAKASSVQETTQPKHSGEQ